MNVLKLRYGTNPHQAPAEIRLASRPLPLAVLNGQPSYINILDALAGWQLVRDMRAATGKASAASFKHVSPAGAAVAAPLEDSERRALLLPEEDLSPLAEAYVRARGADPVSSFGDAAAVSDCVDDTLARVLVHEVSNLIVAPAYEPSALELLRRKQKGGYLILQIDPDYEPDGPESRETFGLTLTQPRNDVCVSRDWFDALPLTEGSARDGAIEDLLVATITVKYTQSNSIAIAHRGQTIGIGAGQQSRIDCTRLARRKAERWMMRRHPAVLELPWIEGLTRTARINEIDRYLTWDELTAQERAALLKSFRTMPSPIAAESRASWLARFSDLALSSDAYIPFRDNIDCAAQSGVRFIAHPGGSVRDQEVHAACSEYGIALIETGVRLFTH